MERQKKIIDASVVVKWFRNEEGAEIAHELLENHLNQKILLITPEFLFLEILNVFRWKHADEKEIKFILNTLYDLQLIIEPTNELILDTAVNISLKYKLSIYDALYAALSEHHNCELITADGSMSNHPKGVQILKI